MSILSDDNDGADGTLKLEISEGMFGGGIFMIIVDGYEWDDGSIAGNIITINFPKDTSMIEIVGVNHLSPDKYTGVCDAVHDPPHSYILSPLKQYESGISFDEIQCKEGFILIQRYDDSPACVTSHAATNLIERGWGFEFFPNYR